MFYVFIACINYGNRDQHLVLLLLLLFFYASPFSIQNYRTCWRTDKVLCIYDKKCGCCSWHNTNIYETIDHNCTVFISTGTVTQYAHTHTHKAEIQQRERERETELFERLTLTLSSLKQLCEPINTHNVQNIDLFALVEGWREEKKKKKEKTAERNRRNYMYWPFLLYKHTLNILNYIIRCTVPHLANVLLPVFLQLFFFFISSNGIYHPVLVRGMKMIVIILEQIWLYFIYVYREVGIVVEMYRLPAKLPYRRY